MLLFFPFGLCCKKLKETRQFLFCAFLSALSFLFLACGGGSSKTVVVTPQTPPSPVVPQPVVVFDRLCAYGGALKITAYPQPSPAVAVQPHTAGAVSVPAPQAHPAGAVSSSHYPSPSGAGLQVPPGTPVDIEGISPLGEDNPAAIPCYKEAVSFHCKGNVVGYEGHFECRDLASLRLVSTSPSPSSHRGGAGISVEIKAEAWIGGGRQYHPPPYRNFNGVMLSFGGGAFVSLWGITHRFGSPQRCPINFQC